MHYEVLFRSWQKHLMDTACRYPFRHHIHSTFCCLPCSEFQFAFDFFGRGVYQAVFNRIFARTISLCLENLENYLLNCFDLCSALLLIRLTAEHRVTMMRRCVPGLDTYFDRVHMLLWPRYKVYLLWFTVTPFTCISAAILQLICDINLKSMRGLTDKKLAGGSADLGSHPIAKRYAEFVNTILTLQINTDASMSDEMMVMNMRLLRTEAKRIILKTSELLPVGKARLVCQINNYDAIVSCLIGVSADGSFSISHHFNLYASCSRCCRPRYE